LAVAFAASLGNAVFILVEHKRVPVLVAYILEPVALLAVSTFTYYNHTRTHVASTALLLFWPFYTIATAIWTRTSISRGIGGAVVTLGLRWIALGFGLLAYSAECLGPEVGESAVDKAKISPTLLANVYSIWVRHPFFGNKIQTNNR